MWRVTCDEASAGAGEMTKTSRRVLLVVGAVLVLLLGLVAYYCGPGICLLLENPYDDERFDQAKWLA